MSVYNDRVTRLMDAINDPTKNEDERKQLRAVLQSVVRERVIEIGRINATN